MMRHSIERWFRQQFGFLQRQFSQQGELPFTDVLSEECIETALATIGCAERSKPFAAGDTVGFSQPGCERRSILPWCRCEVDSTSSSSRLNSMFFRYWWLLSSSETPAREVLLCRVPSVCLGSRWLSMTKQLHPVACLSRGVCHEFHRPGSHREQSPWLAREPRK